MKTWQRLIATAALTVAAVAGTLLTLPENLTGEYTTMAARVEAEYDFSAIISGGNIGYMRNFETLEALSSVILIARAADSLAPENAIEVPKRYTYDVLSTRKLDVLQVLKGEFDENCVFAEPCAMDENGMVAMGKYPLVKGDVYLLFLYSGAVEELKLELKAINLSWLRLEDDTRAVWKYFKRDLPDELQWMYEHLAHASRLPQSTRDAVFVNNEYPWQKYALTTPYTLPGMEIPVEHTEVEGVHYFRIDGKPAYYD